jgi:hypothetical protein
MSCCGHDEHDPTAGWNRPADASVIAVEGDWLVRAKRATVYSIVSDFERMPEHFPRVARSLRVLAREGDRLMIEAKAASFGRLFPPIKVSMVAVLLPGVGYRCSTRNLTFGTTGDEQLLLEDDPEGTRIRYTYYVTVSRPWLRPLYAWLVRAFGLPYWKRAVIDRLQMLADAGWQPIPTESEKTLKGDHKELNVCL